MRNLWTSALLVVLISLNAATASRAELVGVLRVDGEEAGTMDPGDPSRWTIGFRDASGVPVSGFELEHQKAMHLIVVSADLASFAHVHPALDAATGVFTLDANTASADPDNADSARVVTRPGPHFLFTEVRPSGQTVQQTRFTVQATGTTEPVAVVEDPVNADGAIVKYFDANGALAAEGAAYRVGLVVQAMKHDMVHLNFMVERRAGAESGQPAPSYVPVTDLEPWLGMTAHAVMVGAAGQTVGDRIFRHLHAGHHDDHGKAPGAGETGPGVMFMLHGDDVPPHGVYRVWLQTKHQGKILTLPYTFKL